MKLDTVKKGTKVIPKAVTPTVNDHVLIVNNTTNNEVVALRLLLINNISSVERLKKIFNKLDKHRMGVIGLKEFWKLCTLVDKHVTKETLLQLWDDCWKGKAHNNSTKMNWETLEAYLF